MKNHTINKKNIVGPQLCKIRNSLGLSQACMAAKCQLKGWDVSRDIIARIETQTRCITDIEAQTLARILAVPIAKLIPELKK